ncbi:MAG: ethanolamine ammonia-lyase subunit EutC [Pseudomonadota bacterium]
MSEVGHLRRFTAARVGLGRAGHAVPTSAQLDFAEAHARARDAVWSALEAEALAADCALPAAFVRSEARDRREFLLRPDLGRRLAKPHGLSPHPGCMAVVLADGLCAEGVQRHAPALVAHLAAMLPTMVLVIAEQARVALGDAVGEALGASAVIMLIGERPGLSATDSIGAYITWAPRIGRTDAERNCISNIRPGGLDTAEAAGKIHWLLGAARALGTTGVALKDEQPAPVLLPP